MFTPSSYHICPSLLVVSQDGTQVWLAGGAEQSARPAIRSISPAFLDGTYMVCFSDLWRCTEQVLSCQTPSAFCEQPFTSSGAPYGCWMSRRKLFAQTWFMCNPAQVSFSPNFLSSPCVSGGRRGLPLLAQPELSLVSPGNPPHQPQMHHKPAPPHRKARSPGSAVSGVFGRSRVQALPPASTLPPWKITLPTLPLLPTQP